MHTMGQILQNWRVLTATLFSAVLVVGAYLLAKGVESPPAAQASTETALLQAIATKDSDGDGLPDWEEALYGTDPHKTDTFSLGMTDGEAVAKGFIIPKAIADISVATSSPTIAGSDGLPPPPAEGTITAAFAKSFFALFLAAKNANGGADLSETQMNDVASQALNSLSSVIVAAPDYKSAKDITVAGSGADALKAFAVSAEAILLKNTSNATTSEINYLKSALLNNDATAAPHIISIAKAYRDSAVGLAVLQVPAELAETHLALVNAMMRISQITTDFTFSDTDPLATMLALSQYPPAVLALANSYFAIGKVYKAAGISLPAGAPGASFVNLIENVANQQAAAK
ncbi:MAG: thrombospondin type 3 repeat-containing protein, partial [bacterium]|nr:thrombospondin type 3 repeat-containing protein [bacterium]